jgi:hypothetical protein
MLKLFFSYSHKDEDLRNELETHLALLRRQGVISSWHDRRITAGSDLHKAISSELESSHIILLLVSANFLASDYCYDTELERALEKHKEGSAIVIPVILHPCDWESAPFGHLRATPTDGKAISLYPNQHEAFAIVAKDIRKAAMSMSASSVTFEKSEDAKDSETKISKEIRSSNLRIKRKFHDHERDDFLEDSYEYIARYFEESLKELEARNSSVKVRFKRLSGTSFAAFIYQREEIGAECSIWHGKGGSGPSEIYYSDSGEDQRSTFNETLSVSDDGYTLHLKPWGLPMLEGYRDKPLSQQGAAEYFWNLFIKPLQD